MFNRLRRLYKWLHPSLIYPHYTNDPNIPSLNTTNFNENYSTNSHPVSSIQPHEYFVNVIMVTKCNISSEGALSNLDLHLLDKMRSRNRRHYWNELPAVQQTEQTHIIQKRHGSVCRWTHRGDRILHHYPGHRADCWTKEIHEFGLTISGRQGSWTLRQQLHPVW